MKALKARLKEAAEKRFFLARSASI